MDDLIPCVLSTSSEHLGHIILIVTTAPILYLVGSRLCLYNELLTVSGSGIVTILMQSILQKNYTILIPGELVLPAYGDGGWQ
jgi:hypothetical protein